MIVIIGAGLSGLLTAYRLKKAGIPVMVLEARDRIGGRIFTVNSKSGTPVEMGATWFGRQHVKLIALLEELELTYYEQFMQGVSYFQNSPTVPIEAFQIPEQDSSYRIVGGTDQLIEKLASYLNSDELITNQFVKKIKFNKSGAVLTSADSIFEADKVVLALPPKLWVEKIDFQPNLQQEIRNVAQNTETWMEESIKVALIYDYPFWRENNISGTLFSNVGPITEFYDHTNYQESKFALCGFVDSGLKQLTLSDRKQIIIQQAKQIFGGEAEKYIDYQELIWSQEKYTGNRSKTTLFPHQNNGNKLYQDSHFNKTLYFSNTETSSWYGGYMEGAVNSANIVTEKILKS